jgi:hypothetical protein
MGACLYSFSEPAKEHSCYPLSSCVINEDNVYDVDVEMRIRWKGHFHSLFFNAYQIDKLYRTFGYSRSKRKKSFEYIMDRYRSPGDEMQGNIPLREFDIAWLHTCTLHVYSPSSKSPSLSLMELSFPELVLALWNFCTEDKQNLASFVFSIFYAKENGLICRSALLSILDYLHHKEKSNDEKSKRHILEERLEEDLKCKENCFNLQQFVVFSEENPEFLKPIYTLQRLIRRKSMSERAWSSIADKRKEEVLMSTSLIHSDINIYECHRVSFSKDLQ